MAIIHIMSQKSLFCEMNNTMRRPMGKAISALSP